MKFIQLLAFLIFYSHLEAASLQTFQNCTLVPSEWSDGDSFVVKLPDGIEKTVRLYGADTIEIHVTGDESNTQRLREQRRYFGINDILVAKSFGELAKKQTAEILAKPFTLHTHFANARGDGRYSRVYGFVTTSEGRDLSELLVEQGLARAFGMIRQDPRGVSGHEWQEKLRDLELQAARAGKGAWSQTDWEKLPKIREEARLEQIELQAARGTLPAQESAPIRINSASTTELITLPTIGVKTAQLIIASRPYRSTDDLLKVSGIGPKTLEKIRNFITFE